MVHGGPEALFAAEVLVGRLDTDMAKQELDLFQLASCYVAEASALVVSALQMLQGEMSGFRPPQSASKQNPRESHGPAYYLSFLGLDNVSDLWLVSRLASCQAARLIVSHL
jgi:hypothetical protein